MENSTKPLEHKFVTISPKPSRRNDDQKESFLADMSVLRKLLKTSTTNKVSLSCELNDNGYLHYHIVIYDADCLYLFKTFIPLCRKHLGFVNIKSIHNLDYLCNTYLKKQMHWMVDLLELDHLPLTFDDLILLNKQYLQKQKDNDILLYKIDIISQLNRGHSRAGCPDN